MNALEIILLVCGAICIAVSFILSPGKEEKEEAGQSDAALSDTQIQKIQNQVDEVVKAQLEVVSEQAEAQLDKMSAARILELNEFSDTILEEINRNHNEAMFLYDMLNEKAKEVKSTVKSVNMTRQQVEKMQEEAAATQEPSQPDLQEEKPKAKRGRKPSAGKVQETAEPLAAAFATEQSAEEKPVVKAAPKKRGRPKKSETLQSSAKDAAQVESVSGKKEQPGMDKTQTILSLSKEGKENKEIARMLNMGVGEVNLILGLYK